MQEKIICFLIDDDHEDQEIFSLALNAIDEDIDCITASDGVDALNKLRKERGFTPHFIFLDLNMVRMNGRECLKEIKKIPHLNDIPIIIYSTSSEQKDITETKLLGATDYIVKPPSISILTKKLEQVLRKE
ncbi:response regulator [Chitinophaga filiformis]|uniref:Response regulator receiver domain-containing protein n=1 Tax=Chitinophaga filiformis TaxID=104663 RepID=A0A1G7Z5G6_CHIFI|nr:response regulator [Chitinophaga filiformis]SDH03973.1 Response regulator receiver domain-containing protein [Chitinophaga filiformis]